MANNTQTDKTTDAASGGDGGGGGGGGGGKWALVGVSTLALVLAFSMVVVLKGFLGGGPSSSRADTGELGKGGVDWSRFEQNGTLSTNASAATAGAEHGGAGDAQAIEQAIRDSEALRVQGDFQRAEAVLADAVEKHPFDKSLRLTQAQAFIGQQKWKDAYAAYQSAIAIVQSTRGGAGDGAAATSAKQPVTKEEADLHFQAGTIAAKAGLMERSVEHYTMAQAGDPGEPKYPLYLAMVQLKLGQDTPAMASLIRATKLNPDLAEAWGTLAELELRQNHLGLAAQHLDKAKKLQPEVARWRIIEARLLNRQGDAERAATVLLALDPATRQTPQVLELLAESYGLLGKPEEAAAAYAEAARTKVDDPELAYQAAAWCERAGKIEEAKRFARAADAMGDERGAELLKELEQK